MDNIVVVIALFLGFGTSLSWVAGHKERVELTDKLTAKTDAEKKLKTDEEKGRADLAEAQTDIAIKSSLLKEIEEKLAAEVLEREKAEEARLLAENRLQLTEEEKKKIEEEMLGEIDELKVMAIATEEGRKRIELEELLKTEVEARKKAEEKWNIAEIKRTVAEKEARERLKAEFSRKTETELNEEFDRLRREIAAARQEEAELSAEAEQLKSEVKMAAREKAAIEEELTQKKNEGEVQADIPPYELKSGDSWWTEEVIRYKIKKGDTLSRIAANDYIYNDWRLWVVIYEHNLQSITDPNIIYPGQILLIPKITTPGKSEIKKILKEYNKSKLSVF